MTDRVNRHRGGSFHPWMFPVLALALLGCASEATERRQDAGAKGESMTAGEAAHAREGAHPEEEASSELSDLDRPLEDLLAARCEHGIPQHTCDECRYEVGMVKVDPALIHAGGPLDTLRVGKRAFSRVLELDGEVELDEAKSVSLSPPAAGVVRAIHVDLGTAVRARQLLFELDCPDYFEAKAQYLRARAGLALAQATWDRESDLYEKKICPQKDLLEARAARDESAAGAKAARERLLSFGLTENDLATIGDGEGGVREGWLPIRAPFAGKVLERSLSLGSSVEPGQKLLLLGDTSRLWVMTNLYERELAQLSQRGSDGEVPAEVEVSAYPGRVFMGRLDRLQGTLDPVTRTTKARVLVENPGNLLRAGMFARVRLALDPRSLVAAVPSDAVLEDEGRSFVFVRVDPTMFVRRPVRTGESAAGWTEVLGGLSGGEIVVARGAFLLKSDVLRSKMGAGCAD
jgi:membrane fusion protein, heavy metal efflux system